MLAGRLGFSDASWFAFRVVGDAAVARGAGRAAVPFGDTFIGTRASGGVAVECMGTATAASGAREGFGSEAGVGLTAPAPSGGRTPAAVGAAATRAGDRTGTAT